MSDKKTHQTRLTTNMQRMVLFQKLKTILTSQWSATKGTVPENVKEQIDKLASDASLKGLVSLDPETFNTLGEYMTGQKQGEQY